MHKVYEEFAQKHLPSEILTEIRNYLFPPVMHGSGDEESMANLLQPTRMFREIDEEEPVAGEFQIRDHFSV